MAKASMMKVWAMAGAKQRAEELEAELVEIRRTFPDLGAGRAAKAKAMEVPLPRVRRRNRKPMSVAQRKAVGIRMKKYWAERRKKKG